MEPAIYRQLDALPLPADTPAGLAEFLAPFPAIGHEPVNRVAAITPHHQRAPWAALSNPAGTTLSQEDICETLSADWAQAAKFLLRAFQSDLKNDFEKGKVPVSRQNTLKQLITRYLGQADRIAPRTSGAYLALGN